MLRRVNRTIEGDEISVSKPQEGNTREKRKAIRVMKTALEILQRERVHVIRHG